MQFIGQDAALGVNVDPHSGANRFRAARFAQFMRIVNTVLEHQGACSILDVGGSSQYWSALGGTLPSGVTIHLLNLENNHGSDLGGPFKYVVGDACSMPEFADNSFDVVHSNSVIEHVGLWPRMAAMAAEIRRVAPRHYVQTPNFWFPIEPHYRLPFVQMLPEPWRRALVMGMNCGFYEKAEDVGTAMTTVHNQVLLDYGQMRFLFPDGDIVRERFMGLTKSLIAVKAA